MQLKSEYEEISALKPRIVENFDNLSKELNETQAQISYLTQHRASLAYNLSQELHTINNLEDNLGIIR